MVTTLLLGKSVVAIALLLASSCATSKDVVVSLKPRYAPYESTNYMPSADGLPDKTQQGQSGTNKCGTKSSDSAMCQNLVGIVCGMIDALGH